MKNIVISILLTCLCISLAAQKTSHKKPPTIGLHFFYNDFATAQNIKANNLKYVLNNDLWSKPNSLQGGFGIDYMQGLTKKIDVVGAINASWVDYQLPTGFFYGSNNFLLDINAGVHVKLLTDNYVFNPFLIAKVNYSNYKNLNGFSVLPGAGIQINLFKEAFILTTVEYRKALNNSLSNQLYYSIGIATNICKPKAAKPAKEKSITPPVVTTPPAKEEIKPVVKDVLVTVNDEATGQPLQYVDVTLTDSAGNIFNATTNADGRVIFSSKNAGNYNITGRLNKIDASPTALTVVDFNNSGNQVSVTLTHNDPRFTLVGNTFDKSANTPVADVQVTVTNSTQSSTSFTSSDAANGEFRTQLEAASDFVIVGKKASYISNIENLSTKDLTRSTTLYVKLQLGIEEAKAGKNIVLKNLFFQTGRSDINTNTSADLFKLIQFLKDNPAVKLEIQGYTDNVGNLVINQKLSQQRANSVVNYLIKNGIEKERLLAKGFGPASPVADNKTVEGRAQNRRVEMKVL
ncbi:MAG: OmpA family protein [Ferruginibacter sp.]